MRARSPSPRSSSRATRVLVRAGLLLAGFALNFVAGVELERVYRRLPEQQAVALNGPGLAGELGKTLLQAPIREAYAVHQASRLFSRALVQPNAMRELLDSARRELPAASSPFARLQQAAIRMLEIERAGAPLHAEWVALRNYFPSEEHNRFPTLTVRLQTAWGAIYERLGAEPAVAARLAENATSESHGPLVEYLVDRLDRLSADLAERDPQAAEFCRRLADRFLRGLALDAENSIGLRLLAIDLLSRRLWATNPELAAELQALRTDYRVRAAQSWSRVLTTGGEPAPVAEFERTLGRDLTFGAIGWAGSLIILLCGVPCIRSTPGRATPAWWGFHVALLCVALTAAFGRGMVSAELGVRVLRGEHWPWIFAIGAVLGAAAFGIAAWLTRRAGVASLAITAAVMGGLLSVTSLTLAQGAEKARQQAMAELIRPFGERFDEWVTPTGRLVGLLANEKMPLPGE